jgi:hypothetical protein
LQQWLSRSKQAHKSLATPASLIPASFDCHILLDQ